MPQTIVITMTGQLPTPPYQSVFWTVYGEPDNTGAQSGYGADYLINIGVDSVSQTGAAVDPITLQVGGDLTGNLPDPYVSGLQGNPIDSTAPTNGQYLVWNGTAWTPTTADFPSSNVGGDLSGSLPNPTVVKIQGRAISNQAPSTDQILTWSGTEWIGNTLTLGGDVTGSPGSNTVQNLQGVALTVNAPSNGDIIAYNGSRWIQTTPGTPIATASAFAATPSTLALRDSNGSIQFGSSGNDVVQIGGGLVAGPRNATFGLSQTIQGSDVAANDVTLSTQAPFASASGSNRLPGDFVVNIPAAAGALATTNSGNFIIEFGGDPRIQFYENPATNYGVLEFVSKGRIVNVNSITSDGTNSMEIYSNAQLSINCTPIIIESYGTFDIYADDLLSINGAYGIYMDSASSNFDIYSGGNYTISGASNGNITCDGTLTISSSSGIVIDDLAGAAEIILSIGQTKRIEANPTGLGFFNATPVAKPTVTGSKGGNAALASLMTALANLGLVTDSTS